MSSENSSATENETNQQSEGSNTPTEQPAATHSDRQRRVPRRTRNNENNDEVKAQIRAAASAQTTSADEQLTEEGADDGSRIGDNIDPNTVTSISSSSRVNGSTSPEQSGGGSSRSMREPSVRSIYSPAISGNTIAKQRPSDLSTGQQIGAVAVRERAYGSLPAWHRNNSGNNQRTQQQMGQRQPNTSPEMRTDQSNIPPEMRMVQDQSNVPPEMRMVQDQSNIPPEMRMVQDEPQFPPEMRSIASVDVDDIGDEAEESKGKTAKKKIWLFLAVGIVTIGAIVGAVVGTTATKDDNEQPTEVPTGPIQCPDFGDIDPDIANFSEETLNRYNYLIENIVRRLIPAFSSSNTANDECSPVRGALIWLSKSDQTPLQSAEALTNRFLLACHFIAWKGGEEWTQEKSKNWLSDTSECDWYGISCDDDGVIIELNLHKVQNATIGSALLGTIPSEIGLFTTLRSLKLTDNDFTGELPSTLGCLTNLEILDLSKNSRLTGTFPFDSISRLPLLRTLSLSDMFELSVSIPPSIGLLTRLQYFSLARSQIDGEIPSEAAPHHLLVLFLVALNLRQTETTGSIPTEIGKLRNIEYIDMSLNQIEGKLISEIGFLENLKSLSLQYNILSGSLPTEIGKLSSLEHLALGYTDLSGSIPSEIGLLSFLQALIDIDLPSEIGLLSDLRK
eukprot:scaffold66_cov115-Cylindrotheca_fusiformis.AAC.1